MNAELPPKIGNPMDQLNHFEQSRHISIDVFRGMTIAVMVFVNTVAEFDTTPSWSKHALDLGLTYVDLVAPAFIFMVGLTYWYSYQRSIQQGEDSLHF